jgi:mRNA interferase MazF
MKRGDIVISDGRPALVMQSDAFAETAFVTLLPITTQLRDWPLLRIAVDPDRQNGLKEPSQIVLDHIVSKSRSKAGRVVGRLNPAILRQVDGGLGTFLGILI